ncbi:MAG: hypothetical protein KAI73_00335, partial [Rhodospirillaceae bacterium]|nr:hypothetical protein [Rhodospirillaceae bacterium]
LPLRTNGYTYVPCLFPAMLGKTVDDARCSLSQLSALYTPDGKNEDSVYSSVFTYRSMLTYKLLKEGPMPYRLGLDLFRLILPAMMVVTIFHSDRDTGTKRFWLEKGPDGNDVERIEYREDQEVLNRQIQTEKSLLGKLRSLGLLPLKRINRAAGSSIHYCGTLPMTVEERPLTTTPEGRLRPFKRVWVADGSALPFMPAVLPTLSFMAMARRSAAELSQALKR